MDPYIVREFINYLKNDQIKKFDYNIKRDFICPSDYAPELMHYLLCFEDYGFKKRVPFYTYRHLLKNYKRADIHYNPKILSAMIYWKVHEELNRAGTIARLVKSGRLQLILEMLLSSYES